MGVESALVPLQIAHKNHTIKGGNRLSIAVTTSAIDTYLFNEVRPPHVDAEASGEANFLALKKYV